MFPSGEYNKERRQGIDYGYQVRKKIMILTAAMSYRWQITPSFNCPTRKQSAAEVGKFLDLLDRFKMVKVDARGGGGNPWKRTFMHLKLISIYCDILHWIE